MFIHESRTIHSPVRYLPSFHRTCVLRTSLLCALVAVGAGAAASQSADVDSSDAFEINEIRFTGNTSFDDAALKEILVSKETPGGFSKFIYRNLSEKLGSRPEYFSEEKLETDLASLKTFYEEHGFYEAEIGGIREFIPEDREVDVTFTIQEGRQSMVDTIRYLGLEALPPAVLEEVHRNPVIQMGMPYESPKGGMEVSRVLNILANNGYPEASFDADRSGSFHRRSLHLFNLTYVFVPGKLRKFGDITIHVEPPRDDIVDHYTLRQLDFQPGDVYSRGKKISSESNLNRIGLFESARIDHPSAADTAGDLIPIDIYVHPRPRNEVAPELIVSDENNAFNLGLGLGYTNRNFFGDARSFTASVRARTQTIKEFFTGTRLRDTSFIGAVNFDFQIVQPYLFTRTLSGSWTSTIEFDKQREYILSILRNRVGISNRFATYTTGYLDWTLERVSTEFINPTTNADSVIKTFRLEDQPQFNSILTFTLQRDRTNDAFSPTEGFFHSLSLEESGILPKLLKGFAGGLPFTQYYKILLSGRWYEDLSNTRFNILALKLKTGYQEKYGESRDKEEVFIPLNRRFFSGGSGSVRGWRARELGAMSDELLPYGGNVILEASAEMRVNQFRGFGKIGFIKMDAIWMVYFVDFGTVWSRIEDFRMKDVAIAAGVGFRYDTFFGPFRLDFGFKVYDPTEQPGRRTIFDKKLFSETLSSGILHFGLGHAF